MNNNDLMDKNDNNRVSTINDVLNPCGVWTLLKTSLLIVFTTMLFLKYSNSRFTKEPSFLSSKPSVKSGFVIDIFDKCGLSYSSPNKISVSLVANVDVYVLVNSSNSLITGTKFITSIAKLYFSVSFVGLLGIDER